MHQISTITKHSCLLLLFVLLAQVNAKAQTITPNTQNITGKWMFSKIVLPNGKSDSEPDRRFIFSENGQGKFVYPAGTLTFKWKLTNNAKNMVIYDDQELGGTYRITMRKGIIVLTGKLGQLTLSKIVR